MYHKYRHTYTHTEFVHIGTTGLPHTNLGRQITHVYVHPGREKGGGGGGGRKRDLERECVCEIFTCVDMSLVPWNKCFR